MAESLGIPRGPDDHVVKPAFEQHVVKPDVHVAQRPRGGGLVAKSLEPREWILRVRSSMNFC